MDAKHSSSTPSAQSILIGVADVKTFVLIIPLILPFLCFLFVFDDAFAIVQL